MFHLSLCTLDKVEVQQDTAAAQEESISLQYRRPSQTALLLAVRAQSFVVQSHVFSLVTTTCRPLLPAAPARSSGKGCCSRAPGAAHKHLAVPWAMWG